MEGAKRMEPAMTGPGLAALRGLENREAGKRHPVT